MNENKRDCSSGSLFDALLNQFGSLTNAAHLHAQPACVRFGVSPVYMPDLFNDLVVDHFKFILAHHPILLDLVSMISSLAWPSQAPSRSLLDNTVAMCASF